MSCHVTSRHVTSRHVTSRHVTSRHVTSRHVTSRHVTSRHALLSLVRNLKTQIIIINYTPTITLVFRQAKHLTTRYHRSRPNLLAPTIVFYVCTYTSPGSNIPAGEINVSATAQTLAQSLYHGEQEQRFATRVQHERSATPKSILPTW